MKILMKLSIHACENISAVLRCYSRGPTKSVYTESDYNNNITIYCSYGMKTLR